MKNRKCLAAGMLCVLLVLSCASFAAAAKTTVTECLATVHLTYRLPMWHYSGGYWKMGSGKDAKKVMDKTVDSSGGLQQYLTEHYTEAAFCASLPETVREALQSGGCVKAKLESSGNALWTEFFEENSYTVTGGLEKSSTEYTFTLRPRFNLEAQYSFDDFVDGIHNSIPLVHYRFGNNCYSIFSVASTAAGKYSAVQADGFFNEGAPADVKAPYLHPSMIRDKSGVLSDGGVISLNGKTVCTNGLSVGNQTFSQNGATGIIWTWTVNVSFYLEKEIDTPPQSEDPAQPEDPESPEDPQTPADPGQETPEETEDPEPDDPEEIWDICARLQLPESCYEGQWVTAEDASDLIRNGETLSLASAYVKKLASHDLHAAGAKKGSRTTLTQQLQYSSAGTYVVSLEVEAASGEKDTDAKAITVKPCPAVTVSIGGCQKENRKQTLSMEIHQHPDYPVTSLLLELEEPVSGQRVTITRTFPGTPPAPENTADIKYRSLADPESTGDTLFCQLEFLTKFHEDRLLHYRVTAADSRGRQDTAEGTFTVVQDTPPQVTIGLAEVFYREENSNTAVIRACDRSPAAGRYERLWEYAEEEDEIFQPAEDLAGFRDLSMGSGKAIAFDREGVGKFQLRLTVKDLWAEETLEEYVTEADHLQAAAEASSVVDNIAPQVSLETSKAQTADILLLTDSQEARQQLEEKLPQLKALLAAAGLDASVAVDFLRSSSGQQDGIVSFGGQIASPFSFSFDEDTHMGWQYVTDFWNNGLYTADDDAIYVMDSDSFAQAGKNSAYRKRTAPFYIRALAADTHEEQWRFTIPETLFSQPDEFRSAAFGHDVQSRYLYLTAGGQTLILDKACGAMIGMADTVFGFWSYAADGKIYTFRSDGVFRLSLEDGTVSCIRKTSLYADSGAIVCRSNTMHFCEKDASGLWLCTFRPGTETFSRILLSTSQESLCKGMDTRGYVFVMDGNTLRAFDEGGQLLSTVTLTKRVEVPVLSRDSAGQVNYILGAYRKKTGSAEKNNIRKYCYVTIKGIFNGYKASSYFRSEVNGYYRTYSDVELAVELADGIVAAVQPCEVIYGDSHPEYSYTQHNFDTIKGTSNHKVLCQTGVPASSICETASRTNLLEVYSTWSLNIGLHIRISESREAEYARLLAKWGSDICLEGVGADESAEALAERILAKLVKTSQPPVMTYHAGEAIDYKVFYSDYEGDPSRASFWRYVHEPLSDGQWKDSGKTLTAPVRSFTQNGKYTLTHWQIDDAGRGTTDAYDKASSPVTAVFYITSAQTLPPEEPEVPSEPQERSLTGAVEHTAQWEANRQAFNEKFFGTGGTNVYSSFETYRNASSPRLRGTNVFWPGESLQLNAALSGDVSSVTAEIPGTDYCTILSCKEKDPAGGSSRFTGVLYNSSMIETLGGNKPKQVTVRFRAEYTGGATLTYDVPIIFDQDTGYWMLHRTY